MKQTVKMPDDGETPKVEATEIPDDAVKNKKLLGKRARLAMILSKFKAH